MSIDEQIEILKAYKDGKKIEECRKDCPNLDVWNTICANNFQFNFLANFYRIAPEPELIPWEASDVPMPICLVSMGDGFVKQHVVQWGQCDGIYVSGFGGTHIITYENLFKSYKYSTDGVNWKPCGKVKD